MLDAFDGTIGPLAFVAAHAGLREDNGNRVYGIAAALLESPQKTVSFDSLVRYGCFGQRERYLSNLSRRSLAEAPAPDQVRGRLREFLKKAEFVFLFAPGCRDQVLNFCGVSRFVDLECAAEFFLQHLESSSPKRIWEHLNQSPRETISFSAFEIVELSVKLVREISGVCLNDSRHSEAAALRHYLGKSNTLFGTAFVHAARNHQRYFEELFAPCSVPDNGAWKACLEKSASRNRERKSAEDRQPVSMEYLETLFRDMADSGIDHRIRSEQIAYARHVAEALNDGAVLTLEAGTGAGKTRGYLIPVLEFLTRNPSARAAISTYTKSLQEQIFHRELADIMQVFPMYRDVPVALLKGKSSYICAEKLDHLLEDDWTGKRLLGWLYLVNKVYRFRQTDADAIGQTLAEYLKPEVDFREWLEEVSAKNNCTPRHVRCPAQAVTAEAQSARLIVTNHYKLVLLDQDAALAGVFRNCVIDEANHFETAVRNAFGQEIYSGELQAVLRYLKTIARRLAPKAAGQPGENIVNALSALENAGSALAQLSDALHRINSAPAQVSDIPSAANSGIMPHLQSLRTSLAQIGAHMEWMSDPIFHRLFKIQRRNAERVKTALDRLREFADAFGFIQTALDAPDMVAAFQRFQRHFVLSARHVEVAELIQDHIYKEKDCVIFTAATLSEKGSFYSFQKIAGMLPLPEDRPFRFERIASPFDPKAVEIIVPDKAVNGKYENKALWLESVTTALPELIEQNRGRTLVLFASYEDLNRVAGIVREKMADSRYPLLIQQKGLPTVNLCDEFRSIKESVLFGVDTFWYGVDFKGDTLTQVIITRIPYPSPRDPIQMARKNRMTPREYWRQYAYETRIKLRQGIGRLIRSDTDSGKVIILDSRYRESG
ncbi:MAG: ATP-dependent DNA helicase [Desulfobacterales bacterium]|jgi:ATP-dependent DNA helicase DinG|nr:ATP-dependent DNA helicase [Desulfobacterales bacterium]MDD3080837.1 ATP-dependent DNA helicase [Desulfobacterales bacterium]MDD3950079.1 ATP-dependent DNA helicase [Desulfobacterales bacterium]MDD4463257.1 ATP-dependent DNA helicase [Desulfobacterales bacterium]MDY0378103.1 ATP-dependent DNA helicase [Desulfobacterales bacterium]